MDLGLKSKIAVVTGGSVGIGLAIAEGLAAEGVDLALAAWGAERGEPHCRGIWRSRGSGSLRRRDPRGVGRADRRGQSGLRRGRHSHQQRRHRQQRDGDGGAGREVAGLSGLLGSACNGGGAACARPCVPHEGILTPDWIKTAKQLTADSGGDWQAYLDGVAREHAAIKRFATPHELANFFVFLCSERASYSVGSTYFVDGGMPKTV